MVMRTLLITVLLSSALAGQNNAAQEVDTSPVTKVVNLLKEMKTQCEKEAAEDEKIYDNMACWCKTNNREKTAAIETAEKMITDLSAAIDEYTARKAKLATEIGRLEDEIVDNNEALATAAAMREKEAAEFDQEEKDNKEAVGALRQAVTVLGGVQLAQRTHQGQAQVLLQVKGIVNKAARVFRDVMQEDLWDLLSDIGGNKQTNLRSHVLTGLEQQPLEGAAAGAKSYNARSSQIFGILSQMQDEFEKNLASSQKEEAGARIAYQQLRAAKEREIAACNKSIQEKTTELMDTGDKLAKAKQDLEDTQNALSADQKFLIDLKKRCSVADEEFAARRTTRQEEIIAIGETIKILANEDSRDLFSKTMSFVQVGSFQSHQQSQAAATKVRRAAADKILALARKTGNFQLASVAVSVQLDGFEKVKQIMDKMVEELNRQQKEEVAKRDSCTADIDANEDETKVKTHEKEDLEALIGDLEGTLSQLAVELEDLRTQVSESQVSLKRAGEDRKAENLEFQQVVQDQRATVTILQKALARLQSFYAEKESLVQSHNHQEPGAPAPPPPPAGKAHSNSGGAGGVMQMIQMIIGDAQKADQEAVLAEQDSQEQYAQTVANTNAMITTAQSAITEKTVTQSQAMGDKAVAEKDLMAAEGELESLANTNGALHQGCDFVLKNFDVRQSARQDEIEAIQEAKAILSGANFGDF